MQYGILIGRFQPLHKAHQSIIDEIIHDGLKPIIFIGSSNISNGKNPFSYVQRASIIHQIYGGEVVTLPLPDCSLDAIWAQQIINNLYAMNIEKENCIIYHYLKQNDESIRDILGDFKFVTPIHPEIYGEISASDIRQNPKDNKKYLDGRVLKLFNNIG